MLNAITWACFNAEALWNDRRYCSLPSFYNDNQPLHDHLLDEVLLPRHASESVLTLVKPDRYLTAYHRQLGIAPQRHFVCEDLPLWQGLGAPNWREGGDVLAEVAGLFSASRQRPFANIPGAYQNHFTSLHLPGYESVVKVNDKRYAVERCHALNIDHAGTVLHSHSCIGQLSQHPLPLILKEPFGVSGKGSLVVKNAAVLSRVIRHLTRQVTAGRQMALVVEPFLEKETDFSSQWEITEDGSIEFLHCCEVVNDRLKFSGIRKTSDGLEKRIREYDYIQKLMPLLRAVYNDGYWGPVCIDSMLLKDGAIVPVVEVNARESMGNIAQTWFKALPALDEPAFRQASIRYTSPVDFKQLLSDLEQSGALCLPGAKQGIVPLNSRCLQLSGGEQPAIGRLYSIQSGSGVPAYLQSALEKQGATIL